jgi:hypothetical protein
MYLPSDCQAGSVKSCEFRLLRVETITSVAWSVEGASGYESIDKLESSSTGLLVCQCQQCFVKHVKAFLNV